MPSAKRDMRDALKNRVALTERPQIVEVPGERNMPGAKLVAVARVRPHPNQPRKQFDQAALDELAASIRDRGIMQPLVVRPSDSAYTIIMGERRYRAALLAGLEEIPVIVREVTDEQAYFDALIENLQRANLTDEEEAEAYRGLLAQGLSVRQIAEKLGIAPSKVSRMTRIYEDPTLSAAVIEGQITKSQAQELLVASADEKRQLVNFVGDRRRENIPISLDELRREVARTRRGVALRNTSPATVPVADVDSSRRAMIETPLVGDMPHPMEMARQQARQLRQRFLEGLEPLLTSIHDPEVMAELDAIRLAVEHALQNHRL